MADYQQFKDMMSELETFIEKCETKEIESEIHIVIDDTNVDEFRAIIENLITVAVSEDNYVDDILEYLNELDKKITDRNMIAKFIPLFAATHCLALAKEKPEPTSEVANGDWVFILNAIETRAPLESHIGKVVSIVQPTEEEPVTKINIKTPLSGEIDEWEDGLFVVIPGMEAMIKKYQEKYTKTF